MSKHHPATSAKQIQPIKGKYAIVITEPVKRLGMMLAAASRMKLAMLNSTAFVVFLNMWILLIMNLF